MHVPVTLASSQAESSYLNVTRRVFMLLVMVLEHEYISTLTSVTVL